MIRFQWSGVQIESWADIVSVDLSIRDRDGPERYCRRQPI